MREIKFRAWDKEKKKFVSDGDVNSYCVSGDIVVRVEYAQNFRGIWDPVNCVQLTWDEIENLEITQYTGLKDKNGKEIYEGDIVRHEFGEIQEVFWDEDRTDHTGGYLFEYDYDGYEIIGNIHQNPELIKENK